MSGGKGGSSTSTVEIPEYIEAAAQRNLNKAERISQLGYVPYYGPDVAAFTPMQQAGFQNTADVAGAFGLAAPTTQRDIMGGMDAPMQYAGGVQGYSSQPMFQQSVDAFRADRPAQADYMDSFFIDPVTGQRGSSAPAFIDYTQYQTAAETARQEAQRERAAAAAAAAAEGDNPAMAYNASTSGGGNSTTSINTPMSYMLGGVNDPFLTSPISQGIARLSTPAWMERQSDGSYVNTGSLAPTTSARPVARPSALDTSGGGGDGDAREDSFGSDLGRSLTDPSYDPPGNVVSRALGVGDGAEGSGASGGDGCVVATHAVESGAFTPHMKREAVVWCMNALHGKWWGEAVRRGYRHLGRKKIEQGKAREHYAEFRRYIDFASGKERTLRGALTFTLRTAQFFAVGLVKKDA